MRVWFIQSERGGESLDGAAYGGCSHRAGGMEARSKNHFGIRIQTDHGTRAGYQHRSIRLTHVSPDFHVRRVENFEQRLAAIELIALLGVSHGSATPHVLKRHHAGDGRAYGKTLGIALSALQRNLLAVSLQLQNFERGGIGDIVKLARFPEAGYVRAGILRLGFVFQPVYLAE